MFSYVEELGTARYKCLRGELEDRIESGDKSQGGDHEGFCKPDFEF